MGIVKLIFVVLLVFVGFYLLKKFRKLSGKMAQRPSTNKILACSVCNMHIPESEAIIQNGKVYCSKEHLK